LQFRPALISGDLGRIKDLPRRVFTEKDVADLVDGLTAVLRKPGGTMTLNPVQAMAIHDFVPERGGFGAIGVGGGKTLITLLLPGLLQAKRPALIIPAALRSKTEKDRNDLDREFPVARNMRVISYEELGRVGAAKLLETYRFDLLILDEAHRAKNRKAGVTRRLERYIEANPDVMVVVLSGTMIKKSIKDFAHLLRWALKDRAPVPSTKEDTEEWAQALDHREWVTVSPGRLLELNPTPDPTKSDTENAREGFRTRLVQTPGVISYDAPEVNSSLRIVARLYDVTPPTLGNFERLRTLWETPTGWAVSEGVILWQLARQLALGLHYTWWNNEAWENTASALQRTKSGSFGSIAQRILSASVRTTAREVRPGLAAALRVLEGQPSDGQDTVLLPKSTRAYWLGKAGFAPSVANDLLQGQKASELITAIEQVGLEGFFALCATEPSESWVTLLRPYSELWPILKAATNSAKTPEAWLQARREWASFVRKVLSRSRTYDTELQVANAVDAGDLVCPELKAWRAIKPTFEPNPIPVWHDDSALKQCETWMSKGPGIVFCGHEFFARELARRTGARYYGAGGLCGDLFIEDEKGDQPIIASAAANGTGRNLQRFSRVLDTALPAGPDAMEQRLGRVHRMGQTEDEVEYTFLVGCREHVESFWRCYEGAKAVGQLTGARHKVTYADLLDMPQVTAVDEWPGWQWKKGSV